MFKKLVVSVMAIAMFVGISATSVFAASVEQLNANPEMARAFVKQLEREEALGIFDKKVPVVTTKVDFSGVPQISAWNLFKSKDGEDIEKESMAKGAVKGVSIEKVGDQYKFIFETQTMLKDYHLFEAEADMTGITITDQATGKEYTSVPVGTRKGAKLKGRGPAMDVPAKLEVTVPEEISGRGPILDFENRFLVKASTNLDKSLPLRLPFPDAMINPQCTFAFSIN